MNEGDSDFLQAQGLGAALELQAVNAIAVAEQVLWGRRKGEGFPELLGRPSSRRAFDDMEVQHTAAVMRQDDENVEHPKGQGGNGEEVGRHHATEVIAKERPPRTPSLGKPSPKSPVQRCQVCSFGATAQDEQLVPQS